MNTYGYAVYGKNIICPVCGKKMIIDDIDERFKGNRDEYWICPDDECLTSAFVRVRYGKVIDIEYTDTDANVIKKDRVWQGEIE